MDDLISRQQVINKIKPWLEVKGYGWGELNMLRAVINELENMPSAQPERKTGQWIPDTDSYYEERFVCSVCGRSYKVDTCMGKPMWDFCPCGADMRPTERNSIV